MEISLRPMSLGEILDRTAEIYRTHFLLFAGIASVYAGTLLVVGLAQTGIEEWLRLAHMNRALLWASGVSILVTYLFIFIFGGIATAANNRAVAWLHLGQPASIRGAYRSILPRIGRYFWLGFLTLIFAWLPVIVIYAGFIGMAVYLRMKGGLAPAAAHQPGPPAAAMVTFAAIAGVLMLALLPALVYGVIMGLRYALSVPACVVENIKARAAIRRSVQLSKASRGRIFVLCLLVAILEIGLVLVSQGYFIYLAFRHHGQLPAGWRVLQQFVGFCTTTFVQPILATGLTLFYYDQRVRKEGYDIEWMMQAAGWSTPLPEPGTLPSGPMEAAAPPPPAAPESALAAAEPPQVPGLPAGPETARD
jgi:hypothetical protein